jgi:antitoxin VapB
MIYLMPGTRRKPRLRRIASVHPGGPPTAKVFWTGRSQAVRLPKAFRVDDDELIITRVGNALLLEPVHDGRDSRGWPLDFWSVFGAVDQELDLGDRDAPPERLHPLGD